MPKYKITSGSIEIDAGRFKASLEGVVEAAPVPAPSPTPSPTPAPTPAPSPAPAPAPTPGTIWEPAAGVRVPLATAPAPVAKKTIAAPALGATVVDSAFYVPGLTMKRLTAVGGPTYSQLQAWSPDEKWMLIVEGGAGYRVIDAVTGLPNTAVNSNADWKRAVSGARWWKDKLYFYVETNNLGGGARIMSIDMTGKTAIVWTAAPTLPRYFRVDAALEQISANGMTAAWMHNGNGADLQFVVVNLATGQHGAIVRYASLPNATWNDNGVLKPVVPNWVAASPLGKYLVLFWDGDGNDRSRGMELFDINTGVFVRNVYTGHAHGDMGVSSDGREFYFSVEPSTSDPHVYYFDGTKVKIRGMDWGTFGHASCRGPVGWAAIAGFALGSNQYAGRDELYLMRLEGTKRGEIVRLAHHRSVERPDVLDGGGNVIDEPGYWDQPKVTFSPTGKIAWNDNWGSGPAWCMVAQA